ncbi:MAG TPA: hypothetical protein DDW76_30420 [Cyanobacteria bacterium UBA11369]|nr:hypothetical protein [Cyanobacteria bacterium UBA11371]HBE35787.1 hypothetical protein [Cyanobacteria bacterium UBA11368]HBE52959.1 hypothetical protein [Cyanobacteria bacterium UBA11369]
MNLKKVPNPLQSAKDKAEEVAGQLSEEVTEISNAAQEQLDAVLDEYQKVLPIAESLGLRVGSFEVEMGILPQIKTSLVGSLENINNDAVKALIEKHQKNKLLVLIFKALLITKDMQKRLNITNLKGIVVDIRLGVPPKVSVHLAS